MQTVGNLPLPVILVSWEWMEQAKASMLTGHVELQDITDAAKLAKKKEELQVGEDYSVSRLLVLLRGGSGPGSTLKWVC